MTVINSKTTLNQSAEKIYDFLTDLNNHQQLMPANVQNWTSNQNEARFNIQNMAKLAIRIASREPNNEVVLEAFDGPPFPLQIKWEITTADQSVMAKLTIAAELNMMMSMLANGPLQKLADHETQRLLEIFS